MKKKKGARKIRSLVEKRDTENNNYDNDDNGVDVDSMIKRIVQL